MCNFETATLSPTNFSDRVGFAESKLTLPVHREIYYYINDIDDNDLKKILVIGESLHKFKEHYYNLKLSLDELTRKCKTLIGTKTVTAFQFIHGWTIFFNYFLARGFGKSEVEVQQIVDVNYGITYFECERVFDMLRSTQDISNDVDNINDQFRELTRIFSDLIKKINEANNQNK